MVAGLCLAWQGGSCLEAGSLYVYTDAQGQPVLTDNLEQIPAAYRGRIRTVAGQEVAASATTQSGAEPTLRNKPTAGGVETMLSALAEKVSNHPIKGLTPYQTAVLIAAGVCWVVLLSVLFLSANPAVRLLSKLLMLVVGVSLVYQMFVGNGIPTGAAGSSQPASEQTLDNVMGRMRSKTEQSYRLQDDRTARQLNQTEQAVP